jgi:DNA-binding transcriptional LysR family regulator
MWEHVELREIRVFLALCEELHFGRAAERLGISQTRVSQTIQAVETKIGAPLFERTSRRVVLNERGTRLREEVAPAYERMTDVLRRAHAASGVIEGTLRLSHVTGASSGPHMLAVIEAFEARHPRCRVEVSGSPFGDVFRRLRRGEVDLMTSWLPLQQPDLVVGPVVNSEPRVLMVAHDHPLAERTELSVEDLAPYRVPRFPQLPDELHDAWIPSRTPSGRVIESVEVRIRGQDVVELTTRVARGELVHPSVPSSAAYVGVHKFSYVPITDLPPLRSALAWRRGCRDLRVLEYARIAEEIVSASDAGMSRTSQSAPVQAVIAGR